MRISVIRPWDHPRAVLSRSTTHPVLQSRLSSIYTGSARFTADRSSGTVNAGGSLTVNVTFTPNALGWYQDTLFVQNNSAVSLFRVALTGNSPAPGTFGCSGNIGFRGRGADDDETAADDAQQHRDQHGANHRDCRKNGPLHRIAIHRFDRRIVFAADHGVFHSKQPGARCRYAECDRRGCRGGGQDSRTRPISGSGDHLDGNVSGFRGCPDPDAENTSVHSRQFFDKPAGARCAGEHARRSTTSSRPAAPFRHRGLFR